ncbi:MAG: phosphatidylserine decarboxylase [Pseudomonadota bacterium]
MAVWIQYIIPKRALTERVGRMAAAHGGRWTTAAIRWFVRRYGVDMSEAAEPAIAAYATFNDFFTRPLRVGARPLGNSTWVSPVDGAISQLGALQGGELVQAKGHTYTAQALLGGDVDGDKPYLGGHFATLYLSPKDYHRIHMPCAGELKRMIYVPGDLFSVNPATAAAVPGLFARNERVVCEFDTEHGPMAMVLVGATIVGSVQTVWHGVVHPPRRPQVHHWHYAKGAVRLARGDEMGRFLLGSTVVMLWGPSALAFEAGWVPGASIRMGQNMASVN